MNAMNTKTLTISGFAMGAILLAGLPRPAAAVIDEFLVYPGSNCIKQAGAGSPTFTSGGRLQNNTAGDMTVQCPMYDNGFDFTGHVWVIDPVTPGNIACSSVIKNPLGNPNASQPKSTSGFSSSVQALSLMDLTGPETFLIASTLAPCLPGRR